MVNVKKVAIFVGGMLFGSAGFKILASKDAKKVYTQTTAAVLRMKDCTMETVSRVQEEAGDILADAKAINEARAAAAEQEVIACLLYTSPSPRDTERSRMPSSA